MRPAAWISFVLLLQWSPFSLQSTLAEEIAFTLNVPCLHLDEFLFRPDWEKIPTDEFRENLKAALDASKDGWVVDGNYWNRTGNLLDEKTDVICTVSHFIIENYQLRRLLSAGLDIPALLAFFRLLKRTLGRIFGVTPQCAPGCRENWREAFFSKNSILLFAIQQHSKVRRREIEHHRTDGVEVGGIHRRIGGWGRELAQWKNDFANLTPTGKSK